MPSNQKKAAERRRKIAEAREAKAATQAEETKAEDKTVDSGDATPKSPEAASEKGDIAKAAVSADTKVSDAKGTVADEGTDAKLTKKAKKAGTKGEKDKKGVARLGLINARKDDPNMPKVPERPSVAKGEKLGKDEKDAYRRAVRKAKQERREYRRDHPLTKLGKKRADQRHQRAIAERTDPMFYRHHKVKVVSAVVLAALMVLGVSALALSSMFGTATSNQNWTNTGKVAATVGGLNIMEDTITQQIMYTRSAYASGDDQKWAQYLVDQGETPESLRKTTIEQYEQTLLTQLAEKSEGITVNAQDREDNWNNMANNAGGEDNLVANVKNQNTTVEAYKQSYDSTIAEQKLKDKVAPKKDVSDQDVIDDINQNIDKYRGTRRSENLLFSTSDEEKANEVLKDIQDGKISFEDAVEKYSTDTGSKSKKGDVGWDSDNTFVDAYETALKGLKKGEISGVVKSDYGYHIIKCTDVFDIPDGQNVTDIKQVPDDIAKSIRDTKQTSQQTEDYDKWFEDFKSKQDIKVNDMPEGLPYDVSLDGVTPSNNASSGQVAIADGNIVSSSSDGTTTTATTTIEDGNGSE